LQVLGERVAKRMDESERARNQALDEIELHKVPLLHDWKFSISFLSCCVSSDARESLSSKVGTYKTVKARFWP
jgi:hypothetical protein